MIKFVKKDTPPFMCYETCARTKDQAENRVLQKIRCVKTFIKLPYTHCIWEDRYINAYMDKERNVYLFHYEKHRIKTVQTQKKIKNKNVTTVKVLSYPFWRARVYKFPFDRVVSAKQYVRHFEVVLTQ